MRRAAFVKRNKRPELAELNVNRLWRVLNYVLNDNAPALLKVPISTEELFAPTIKR